MYKTIDLCSGIGGIRKGFEKTGFFQNVLSAEIDKYACLTYEHLFKENPFNDVTLYEFKELVKETSYDILLAGFPCQTFSRAGLQEGFNNAEKGIIFSHIADIIAKTRPDAFLLENVDHLTRHDKGHTFKYIIEILEKELNYKVIGVNKTGDVMKYSPKSFIRNSRNFGVPQNRPRTFIMGFNREKFGDMVYLLRNELPEGNNNVLYKDINDVLEKQVEAKYYLAEGYLKTLENHKERQTSKGYGFGYKVVNSPGIKNPIANTLLARGGSGRERNLIYQPTPSYEGKIIKGKRTPINKKGIRVMTPYEWGKLQGFINYAFLDENSNDLFSFPDGMSDIQKYKQFGNSVTIPVIEEMAHFMLECLNFLHNNNCLKGK